MFNNIVGNDKVKQELEQSVKLNKISHSYLFIGTNGIGKKMIAKEFAKMILCIGQEKYCNKCKSCIEFDSNNNPDFSIIEPDGTSIKIEQIRQMQKKIVEIPIISNRKVYIINDANLMTKEAQNCLLKTLEEPPEYVTIVLIGSKESDFLSTIRSRCAILKFQNISKDDTKKYLMDNYNVTASENLLEISQGSISRAIEIANNEDLYNSIYNIIENIGCLDIIDTLKRADAIYKNQEKKFEILESINVMLFNMSNSDLRYLNCIDIVEETKKRLISNSNYNMCIDNMLFRIWEEMN